MERSRYYPHVDTITETGRTPEPATSRDIRKSAAAARHWPLPWPIYILDFV